MSYGALGFLRRQYLCVLRRCAFLNACAAPLMMMAAAHAGPAPIVPDGRTATTLAGHGTVTDIHTTTVRANTAFNSFSRFNIGRGQTVNLHLPGGTSNLLNLVRNERSTLDGVMNAYKDGRIGGNVFFFNPHGIAVGAGGQINVGSLLLATPSAGFMDRLIDGSGNIENATVAAALEGRIPLSESGLITVEGRIRAARAVNLSAAGVRIGADADISAGAAARVEFGAMVNIDGLDGAATVLAEGDTIRIVGSQNVSVAGRLAADGSNGAAAGRIGIDAGKDITLADGARVSADGHGARSDGGDVRIFAGNTASLAAGAEVSARGGEISGDGGHIEFSAARTVRLEGGALRAGATDGRRGAVLIDPEDIEVVGKNQYTDGADYSLIANDRITVDENVTISTRDLSDVNTGNHLTGASQGDSGDLSLKAKTIELKAGSRLLAHADNGKTGGDVKVEASELDAIGANRDAEASISATKATITGKDILIRATAETSGLTELLENDPGLSVADAQRWVDNELDDPVDGVAGQFFTVTSKATASTTLLGSKVTGSGDVTISSRAGARTGFSKTATATTTIGDSGAVASEIRGRSVTIDSSASTSLVYKILGTATTLLDQSWLPDPDGALITTLDDTFFDFSSVPLVALSTAKATTLIDGATAVTGADTVTISSQAVSAAKPTFSSPFLFSAAWGESTAEARTRVLGTSRIVATNALSIEAATDTEIDVSASVNSINKPVDATFVRANTHITTLAEVGAGTQTTGGSIKVDARTEARINAAADAKNTGGSGVGLALAISDSSSETTATLGGTAQALSGKVEINANADIEESTSANAATLGNPSSISARITNFKAGIQRNVVGSILGATGKLKPATAERITTFLFPGIKEGKFNAAGAVAWSNASNIATASISPLADVRAQGDISVTAKISDRPGSSAGAKTTSTGSAIGGSVARGNFANTANASIGSDATVDARGATLVDAQTVVPYPWQIDWTDPEEILDFLKGGVLDMFLSTYSINSAKGKSGLGLAVGVNIFDLANNANAWIDEGARLNTRFLPVAGLATQSVKVSALNDVSLTAAVGILSKKFLGTSGGKAAVGGSADLISIDTKASATIRGDAEVNSAGLDLNANDIQRLVSVTEAGGSSDAVGIEGAVSINTLTNNSLAAIDDDAKVDAKGDVTVDAHADLESISVAGGVVATKGQVGIGFSVSLNTIASDVAAYIGNYDPLGLDLTAATGHLSSTGAVNLVAYSDISQGAYSVAGALATNSKAQTEMPAGANDTQDGSGSAAGASKSGKGKFGIAVSADVSINDIDADTQAFLSDGASVTKADSLAMKATNKLAVSALSGGVTISTQQSGNGLAGSYAQNSLKGTTAAFADDATVKLSGAFDADAHVTGKIESLSASVAGTKGKLGVAGSVSINDIDNTTRTGLDKVALSGVSTVDLKALDDSTIRSIAGAIAFGGKAGVGLSFSWNKLGNDSESAIEDSDVDATGAIKLDATTDNSIDTISAAIGASKGAMAGAGAVTINTIGNSTRAWIAGLRGGDGVDSTAGIALHSTDSSRIFGLAGALGASTDKAGVGVSFAWNDVGNTVDARLKGNTNVESTAGDITVKSDSTTRIEAISASGGVANKVGVAGSGSVVQAKNTVKAGIDAGSTAIADGNLHVGAADDVDLFSLAGNVSGGGKVAIGASASVLITDNTVEARIDGSATGRGKRGEMAVPTGRKDGDGTVLTENTSGVAATATSHEDIQTIAAGGSGGGSVGVAGSATVTDLTETTTAAIGSAATINPAGDGATTQDVTVRASDQTKLLGVAGAVAFGGRGGVGAGADVGLIDKTTKATVGGNIKARDTVTVEALSNEDITSVAASLSAGGSAGIAGSASVYVMNIATTGEIADAATVNSDGNVIVSSDDANEMDMIAGNGAFGGTAGVGASAAVAVIDKTTTARVGKGATINALGTRAGVTVADGSFATSYTANSTDEGEISAPAASNPDGSDSQALSGQRVSTRGTTSGFQGLAVTATNKDDVETISATGSAAGTAAITIAGDVNVITTHTTAEIADDAQVNQSNSGAGAGQSVLVAAGNDHYQMGIAGSASGAGTVGIGAGADVLVAKHTTVARVGDSADVRARKDVAVLARADEEILSIAAGLGVGGTVGVAGSTSVLSMTNVTSATTGTDSVVDADGNVRIVASDDTETDIIDGTLAAGFGAAGVGGAVGVNRIQKDTTAGVGANATVKARGNNTAAMQALSGNDLADRDPITGLMVEANSSEDLFSVAASGAGGFYAGVSGAVTITSLDSDTTAVIGSGAQINQGVTNGSATQDVNVSARNHARLDAYTGSLALGAVGAAGGVDVGTVRNDTTATIDDSAKVAAKRDVDVNALTSAEIDSVVVSASGGLGAIAGGVAVYSVGSGLDAEGRSRLKSTGGDFADVNSYADDQAADGSVNSLLAGSDDARIRDAGNRSQSARAGVSISGDLASAASTGTTASIGDADVSSGGAVDIDARQDLDTTLTAGAAAGGALGLGAGIGVLNINAGTAADIAAQAGIDSGGAVSVLAHTGTTSNLTGFAGSFGGVVLDAAVAIVTDKSSTEAGIGDGVVVDKAGAITVSASDKRTAKSKALGASVGSAAVGASVAEATIGGGVTASVGDGARIGQGSNTVGSLAVTATSASHADSYAMAAKAGLGLAAGGAAATSKATPTISATLGATSRSKLDGAASIAAGGSAESAAEALGVNISAGGAAGASVALATAQPTLTASVGKAAELTAASLAVTARQALPGSGVSADAHATGASGGLLVGLNATVAEAHGGGVTTAAIGDLATITTGGATTVEAAGTSTQRSDASGLSLGIVALGANVSTADTLATTTASTGEKVKLHAATTTVKAASTSDNLAEATAGGGGVVSGLASQATTRDTSTTLARVGSGQDGSNERAIDTDTFTLTADHASSFNARVDSTNASVVGASGAMASNTVTAVTSAVIDDAALIKADSLTVWAHNSALKPWLSTLAYPWLPGVPEWNVKSGSGGLFDLPAARSDTGISQRALVRVGDGASIVQTGSTANPGKLSLGAENQVIARDKVKVDSGGAIAVPGGDSKIRADLNTASVQVGYKANGAAGDTAAKIDGLGDVVIGTRAEGDIYTQVAVDTYGVAGAPEGNALSRFTSANQVSIGNAALTAQRDILIAAGQNTSGQNDLVAATARTDLFNNTLIPISTKPGADARITTTSTISLGSDALLRSARHTQLFAQEGSADASGVGIGKDIYREALASVASAISEAFGGEKVSFEIRGGSSAVNKTSSVAIDGTVEVGINRKQELEIGIDGTVSKKIGSIGIANTQVQSVAGDIVARIETLQDLIRQYSTSNANTDAALAVEAYKSEIRFLERKLEELGFKSGGADGGFASVPSLSERQAAEQAVSGMQQLKADREATIADRQADNSTRTSQNTSLAADNVTLNGEITSLKTTRTAKETERAGYTTSDPEYATLTTEINNLTDQINTKQSTVDANKVTITTNDSVIASNDTEIADLTGKNTSLQAQIDDVQADIDSGSLSTSTTAGPSATFLTLTDATAQLGNIYIRGDRLSGSGTLDAPGDAEIRITNNGPSYLVVNNFDIPPNDGGKLYFNDASISNNAQINGMNGSGSAARFAITTADTAVSGSDGSVALPEPAIIITSKYDPLDPFYSSRTPAGVAVLAPDIVVRGTISNPRGLAKIESAAGSIRLEQDSAIRAKTVDVMTRNGDFVQSYSNTFSHVAGEPLTFVPGDPTIHTLDRIDGPNAQDGKGIIANGSVLLAARYLNINGTVQSGIVEWGVQIPATAQVEVPSGTGTVARSFADARSYYQGLSDAERAVPGAEYFAVSGASTSGLGATTWGTREQVAVSYNAKENRLELAGVQVQGGYIEIFGQVFNTNRNPGAGRLRVLDGYGQITVDNQSGLAMVVNLLDAGRGAKGEINITDIVGIAPNGTPVVKTTHYTRDPGDARTGEYYDPVSGLRYSLTKGTRTVTEEKYRYSQSGWFGIEATKTTAIQDQYRISSISKSNDPLSKGEYLGSTILPSGTNSNTYFYSTDKPISREQVTTAGRSWKECNWWTLCANAKYYAEYYRTVTQRNVQTYSVKADYPIAIEYIGFDQGAVTVSSNADVLMNGAIFNRDGNTSVSSSAGAIGQLGSAALITGNSVALSAATGIGSATQAVDVQLAGGKLDATTASGDIHLQQAVGDLRIGTVGGRGAGLVSLTAEGSLLGADATSSVQGRRVELTATNGGIGVLDGIADTPLVVRTGYSSDTGQWPDLGLAATARDNIFLRNLGDAGAAALFSGNLLLVAVESRAGDVRIETSGTLIDNNPFARTDERAVDELAALWDSLRLRGSRADDKADEQVASFEAGVTQDYRTYWNLRNRQATPAGYDPGYRFELSAGERQQFVKLGWSTAQIDDYSASRTAEYHQLHARLYGDTPDSVLGFVPDSDVATFAYKADDAEETRLRSGSKWSESQLQLAVAPGLLKEITDTVTLIKAPNVKGRNVTLLAGTGIGSTDAPRVVDLSDLNAISREDKAALAAAERGDASVDPTDPNKILILQPRPINLDLAEAGRLTAQALSGQIYLGSEGTLPIGLVSTPDGEIRIKTSGSLMASPVTAGATSIFGKSLILESADGGIGTVDSPMHIRLASGSTLTARAAGDIHIIEDGGDLNVDTLYSRRGIRLQAAGSILDAFDSDDTNIRARSLMLTALAAIGEASNYLDIGLDTRLEDTPDDEPDSWLFLSSGTGTFIRSASQPLVARAVDAGTEARLQGGAGITVDGAVTSTTGIDIATGGTLALSSRGSLAPSAGPVALSGDRIVTETGSRIEPGNGRLDLVAGSGGAELSGRIDIAAPSTVNVLGTLTLGATGQFISQDVPVSMKAGSIVLEGGTRVDAGTATIALEAANGNIESHSDDGSTATLGGGNVSLDASQDVLLGGPVAIDRSAVTISAGRDLRADSALTVSDDASLVAGHNMQLDGTIDSDGNITARAEEALASGGTTRSGADISLSAGTAVALDGAINAGADLAVESGTSTTLAGAIAAARGSKLLAGSDIALTGGSLASGGDAELTAGRDLLADADSRIDTGGDLKLSAGRDMRLDGAIDTGSTTTIDAARDFANGGRLAGAGDITVTAGTDIELGGTLTGGARLDVASSGTTRVPGVITAADDATLAAADDIAFAGGSLTAPRVRIIAGTDGSGNVAGSILAGPDIVAAESAFITAPGVIGLGAPLEVLTPRLDLEANGIDVAAAPVDATDALEVTATGVGGSDAASVKLALSSENTVRIGRLYATASSVSADTPNFKVVDGRVGDYATFYTPDYSVHIDRLDRRVKPGFDARGFTLSGNYDLDVTPDAAHIGAFLIHANPRKVVFSTPGGNASTTTENVLASQNSQGRKDLDLRANAARAAQEPPGEAGLVSIGGGLFDCNGRSGCDDSGAQ
ncbi:leukotoxin LktA family filamentous adhesin [Cognatazoarcus halotolerans]|uniref:leukotoxin LktA family filamentous adhesin n=1 Tax=Cognatazoarcus halotolerans TaxID=2686016 RepID=UPI001359DC07|nr:leukotoxin LktA family filamentous adhesin [Cognatazoarcus halotolerans]MCP5307913.1 leukotoxin LktA family filamentous adhesin [Zoogloeaceae bacterium]